MSPFLLAFALLAQSPPGDLPTIAEKSDYQATASHAQVIDLCRQLAERSKRVRLGELGKSAEGREIPLLILADPPVSTAEEARQQAQRGDKLLVFGMGNIHAGEVCGKEALLMLARELALAKEPGVLQDLIVVFAPLYNPDGNERVSKENRPHQRGPAEGVGIRENAAGLDLNRDFVKLEAPETQALVRFYNAWQPDLVIDTHTTNGSHHRYTLTYDGPRHPATDPELVRFVRDEFLPEVGRRLETQTGYKSFYYGNFNREHTHWTTYPAQARYGGQYGGLRNQLTLLSEAYVYAPFRDRVLATQGFVRHALELAAERKAQIAKIINAVRQNASGRSELRLAEQPSGGRRPTASFHGAGQSEDAHDEEAPADPTVPHEQIALRSELVPLEKSFTVLGYVEEERDGKRVATDQERDYEVRYVAHSRPTASVARPYAYLIAGEHRNIIDKLHQHGIELHVLREDLELEVEVYRIEELQRSQREYQKHQLVSVLVTPQKRVQRFKAGSVIVSAWQPLALLAMQLLEPAAEDSLCTWNYFDEQLRVAGDFPVARLAAPQPMLVAELAPPDEKKPRKPITFETLYGRNPPSFSGSPASGFQ